jgi:DNA excision repair protein ERCC-2
MSATLSPINIYSQIVGLDNLDRPTTQDQFGLQFPKKNRKSMILPLTRFTASNRNSGTGEGGIKQEYKDSIFKIITATEGNTLICMPSYDEAEWISSELENNFDIPIYLDESSSNDETHQLRESFVANDKAVLVTSLRGTLTEGVDYEGDDLSNVIVVGVSLANPFTDKAEAVKTAYALRFSRKKDFEYAFTVPSIYKSRQAIGRVIRSTEDVGTRILIDERYKENTYRSVNKYLSKKERREFEVVKKNRIEEEITNYWNQLDK